MASNATSPTPYFEWQVPPAATQESRKLGWLNEACEEGQLWLKSQRGFLDFRKSLDMLSGIDTSPASAEYRSKVSTNRLKRNFREVVGTMAKLRPMWGYHSDNKSYAEYAGQMNKVTRSWYLESFADRKIKEALQYSGATGLGWAVPMYRRKLFGTGPGDIQLFSFGAPCVLPNQLPASRDWQEAYAVHILDEMPVAMAHGMFPSFQHRLTPSSSRYWYMNDNVRKSASGNWAQRAFASVRGRVTGANSEALTDLLVPIRRSYIIDLSINTTKFAIPMGEPGASWSYTVPFVGQDIPIGIDPRTGHMSYRKATETDARLYPYRRLMMSTDTCCMYDGPGFDWHGMFPGVSFSMDDFPWEPLGFSLTRDGYEIQKSINEIVRGNMDKIGAQLQPSMAFDNNVVAMAEARRFDPFRRNDRIGYDGSAGEGMPIQTVLSEEALKVTPESMAAIAYFESVLDHQMGIADIQALAKMRAVGSMDDLEKIMEANGPIIEDNSRGMEPSMRDLGNMVKYLICQYYTTTRIMQLVGPDGVARGTFDFDPESLVPSHMPGENPDHPSPTDRIRRARTFCDNLRFLILPGSLHEITQMQAKLALIQLKKIGVKISSQLLAEAFSVPNYGSFDGADEIARWKSEQETDLEFAARMMAIKAALGGGGGGDGGPGGPAASGGPGGTPMPGPPQPEGRPNVNTAPAHIEQKDGGTRSTVATSK